MADNNKKPVAGSFSKLMAPPEQRKQTEQSENKTSKKTDKKESNIACNITLLHLFNAKDIEELREPAYMAQTYRLREQDVEWVKDMAHTLSKEAKHRRISQTDIVRISFKLFDKMIKNNKEELKDLLNKIK